MELALVGLISVGAVALIYIVLQMNVGTKPKNKPTWSTGNVRELGLLERWYSASHVTGVMMNFCAVIHGTCETEVLKTDLEEAMQQVCEQYTMLKMTILDDDKKPQFQQLENLNYSNQITLSQRDNSSSWTQVVERENMLSFDYAKGPAPLWRLILVGQKNGDFELIFTIHHAICDGRACLFVTQKILDAYQRVRQKAAAPATRAPPTVPMDALLDCRPTIGYIAKVLTKHRFSSAANPALWLGNDAEYSERKGHLFGGELTPSQSANLLQQCRNKKTTVQAYLVAAAQIAFFAAAEQKTVTVECGSAVDLRLSISPRPSLEQLGTFACDVKTQSDITAQTNVWELVKKANTWTPGNILVSRHTIGVIEFAGSVWKLLREFRDKKLSGRTAAINISNIGAISGDEKYDNITVKSARYAQLKPGEGPVFNVCVMTLLPQNILTYSCAYCVPNITHEQAHRFHKKFEELLVSV